jgi:enoyl-CoA hydratase/carnithine racemase
MSSSFEHIIVDEPTEKVRRITLNRPEKRNALSNAMRTEIFAALERADRDKNIHVSIIRGAGSCFSAGYDLSSNLNKDQPYYTAGGVGSWVRHAVDGTFRLWDLAKPVIAQVHGHCLAGGSELATACDLVYIAEDAKVGYPTVRAMGTPDLQFHPWMMGMRKAMEHVLTGDSLSGIQAVESGFANQAVAESELEQLVLEQAKRVAMVPRAVSQLNKRTVHRAMEIMGARAAMRSGTDITSLCFLMPGASEISAELKKGVSNAVKKRDEPFNEQP